MLADRLDGPQAQFHDRAGTLGDRDEDAGGDGIAIQQAKSHQRLDACRFIGRDVQDRLVDKGNKVLRNCDLQKGGDVFRFVAGLRIVGIEQLHAIAAIALGDVKRAIGLVDDLLQLAVRIGAGEGGADADSDDEGAVAALVMCEGQAFHGMADRFGKLANLLFGLEWRQHDEFFAAITADRGAVLDDCILQGIAHGHETLVAFLVAITVVVFLEEIDIDQEYGKTFFLLHPVIPQQAQMVIDGAAVLQPGQGIGVGKTQQRLATLIRRLLLGLRFQPVDEDMVAFPVQVPVHIRREDEAGDIEGAESEFVESVFRKLRRRQKIGDENDAR